MNNSLKLLTAIFFGFSNFAISCDCKTLMPIENVRQISINESDFIFLGELLEINSIEQTYSFRIIEVFKGIQTDSVVKGKCFSSCSLFPTDNGKWIVYSKMKGNLIDMNQCLASRSEQNPLCLNCYKIPDPLTHRSRRKEKREFKTKIESLKKKALEDWNSEIEILRREKQ